MPKTAADEQNGFITEAKGAMNEVRRTLAALVEAVGANPQQPQEISRRFGLDKTLTWKVARFICDDDMVAAASHLPGRASVRNLVEAMLRGGATPERAQTVLDAMDRFETLVATHAGDRETFETMLGAASVELAKRRGEVARKQLYQGASALWGVQARVHVSLHFVAPSVGERERLDLACICGLMDFRRLRSDVAWTVARRGTFVQDGTEQVSHNIFPLDETVDRNAPPILAPFCSQPAPALRSVRSGGGTSLRFELQPGPVGNTASQSCILGWIARSEVAARRSEGDPFGEHIVRLSTPAEVLYHDLFVHKSLEFAMNPRALMYSEMPGGPIYPNDGPEAALLPLNEEVIDLGPTPIDAVTSDIPGHRDMVDLAIRRMGHGSKDFHGYRLRMRHPPIPALAVFRYDLPPG